MLRETVRSLKGPALAAQSCSAVHIAGDTSSVLPSGGNRLEPVRRAMKAVRWPYATRRNCGDPGDSNEPS